MPKAKKASRCPNVTQNSIGIRDRKAREIGLLVGIPGQLYFSSISRISDVYIDYINGKWHAWRERYYIGDLRPSGIKKIASGTFEHVLVKTENYLYHAKKKRK